LQTELQQVYTILQKKNRTAVNCAAFGRRFCSLYSDGCHLVGESEEYALNQCTDANSRNKKDEACDDSEDKTCFGYHTGDQCQSEKLAECIGERSDERDEGCEKRILVCSDIYGDHGVFPFGFEVCLIVTSLYTTDFPFFEIRFRLSQSSSAPFSSCFHFCLFLIRFGNESGDFAGLVIFVQCHHHKKCLVDLRAASVFFFHIGVNADFQ